MKEMWLIITLKSDMCTSSGAAIPGILDTDIEQEYGLPIIRAKRIKGCLKNIGMELCDNIGEMQEAYQALFGNPGQETSSSLFVSDAHLYKIPALYMNSSDIMEIEDYEELKEQIKNQKEQKEDILDILSRFRTQTAIEENKTAKNQSLRTIRVTNKGIVFRAKLKIKENTKEIELFLKYCVQGLRHIGIGITRGLGEVHCELKEIEKTEEVQKENKIEAMYEKEADNIILTYQLYLRKPLLIGNSNEACSDQISGKVILGAMAGMYIEDYIEHSYLKDNAHRDSEFQRLFLKEGVQFQTAFPEVNGIVFYPCPNFIKRFKREDIYINLTKEEIPDGKKVQGEKASIFLEEQGEKILFYLPEKEVRIHHARPQNRGIGHAFEEKHVEDRSYTGQLYSYTSLREGQSFQGKWIGKKEDIERLLSCLEKRNNHMWLGRSRIAEYGEVEFRVVETAKEREREIKANQKCILWFLTPMLLRNKNTCRIEPKPELFFELLKKRLKTEVKLVKSYLGFTEVSGYSGKWKLPKAQQIALDAGTAFKVIFERDIFIREIENLGWGVSTNEGYGQVKVLLDCDIQKGEYPRKEIILSEKKASNTNQIIEWLKEYGESKKKEVKEKIEAIKKVENNKEKLDKIRNTTLYQISELIDRHKTEADYYEKVTIELNKICDEEKKEAGIKLIECCKGKTAIFAQTYIQNAIWSVRGMKDGKE